MAQQLHQNLTFVNVPGSGQVTLPHNLNFGGPQIPDIVFIDTANTRFISATDTDITIQNIDSIPQTISVRLFCYHTINREFGGGATEISPRPYVVYSGPVRDSFVVLPTAEYGTDFVGNNYTVPATGGFLYIPAWDILNQQPAGLTELRAGNSVIRIHAGANGINLGKFSLWFELDFLNNGQPTNFSITAQLGIDLNAGGFAFSEYTLRANSTAQADVAQFRSKRTPILTLADLQGAFGTNYFDIALRIQQTSATDRSITLDNLYGTFELLIPADSLS